MVAQRNRVSSSVWHSINQSNPHVLLCESLLGQRRLRPVCGTQDTVRGERLRSRWCRGVSRECEPGFAHWQETSLRCTLAMSANTRGARLSLRVRSMHLSRFSRESRTLFATISSRHFIYRHRTTAIVEILIFPFVHFFSSQPETSFYLFSS